MFFSSKGDGDLNLILEVQSAMVRASLVFHKKGGLPQVISSRVRNVAYKRDTDSSYLIKMTLRSVSELVDQALRELHDHLIARTTPGLPSRITHVYFVLSSPWIVSEAKTLEIRFDKETAITRKYILGLIADERKKAASASGEPLRVIEEKIFDVRLNGYSVADWENKSTTALSLSFTVSVAGQTMAERLITECSKATAAGRVSFHASSLLQNIGIAATHDVRDYALIHAHGEYTDISVMKGHSCIFCGFIPLGVNSIIRKMSKSSDHDENSSDSLLEIYEAGKLDATYGAKSASLIEEIGEGWALEIRKVLRGANVDIPRQFVMMTEGHDSFFRSMMQKGNPQMIIDSLALDDCLKHTVFQEHVDRQELVALYSIAIHSMSL